MNFREIQKWNQKLRNSTRVMVSPTS